jgi:hypothetical protein
VGGAGEAILQQSLHLRTEGGGQAAAGGLAAIAMIPVAAV